MSRDRFEPMARTEATNFGIEVPIFLALIEKESSWRTAAWNPEPAYRYLWDVVGRRPFRKLTPEEERSEVPPADFRSPSNVPRDAEWWGQQASWGLCQVMGAVAREHGFSGDFFTELCVEPELGLNYGARHLGLMLNRYGRDVPRALAAYNGGPWAAGQDPFPNLEQYVRPILRLAEGYR